MVEVRFDRLSPGFSVRASEGDSAGPRPSQDYGSSLIALPKKPAEQSGTL